MIKEILSIANLPQILNFIKPFLTHNHLEYIKNSINRFRLCRDTKAGFIKYSCTPTVYPVGEGTANNSCKYSNV